jgi:hypothetical protein
MFVRIDTRLSDAPRMLQASAALDPNGAALTMGTFMRAILWSCRHRTNGFLPDAILKNLLGVSTKVRAAFVAANLWTEVAGGLQIPEDDYYLLPWSAGPNHRSPDRRGVDLKCRFEVLKRDDFTCRYCGRRAPAVEIEVDHVVPRSMGGTDDLTNLVAACFECNSGKSNRPLRVPGVTDDDEVTR